MYPTRVFQKRLFVSLILILILWSVGQVTSQVAAYDYRESVFLDRPSMDVIDSNELAYAATSLAVPERTNEAASGSDWLVVNEASRWSEQEVLVVEQILDRTWQTLESVGLDGESLLAGYRFRRAPAEYLPGEDRLLAIVNHQAMEITLADGAFKRLHGFYIYHELGHAIDHRLERLPSEIYHRLAEAGQGGGGLSNGESPIWQTADGYWLRYHGRDDREEATADAIAWWVMSQAGQPKPFFPGTPVTTDYEDVSRTIEASLGEVASTGF